LIRRDKSVRKVCKRRRIGAVSECVNGDVVVQEKWDHMTRRWRENISVVQLTKLFLIDEVSVNLNQTINQSLFYSAPNNWLTRELANLVCRT